MSREIKFRAWHEADKCWYAPQFIEMNLLGQAILSHSIGQFEIIPASAIEQYTGLKDKNGKEIYEGDIIQCYLSPISSTIFTGVVEFRPGCIMFKNFADGGAYAFNRLGAIEAVIGNIHENPELLD